MFLDGGILPKLQDALSFRLRYDFDICPKELLFKFASLKEFM